MKVRFWKKGSDSWEGILQKERNERDTLRKSAIRKKSTPISDAKETADMYLTDMWN